MFIVDCTNHGSLTRRELFRGEDLKKAVAFLNALNGRRNWSDYRGIDIFNEETGEVFVCIYNGKVIHCASRISHNPTEGLFFLDLRKVDPTPRECTCDFSMGQWGCTCGYFEWEKAQRNKPETPVTSVEDNVPF